MRRRSVLPVFLLVLLILLSPVQSFAAELPEETAPVSVIPETLPAETVPEDLPLQTEPQPVPAEESLPEETLPETQLEIPGPGIYFGCLHGHSTISDGNLSPEELYQNAQAEGLDFFALTDYSDSISPEDWSNGTAAAKAAPCLGLYGFEIGWPRNLQLGHISVFGADTCIPWQDFGDYGGALEACYQWLAHNSGAVGQFQHPGTQFGFFEDFGHHSPAADQVMALLEIDFSGSDPLRQYVKALDAGWHPAPSGAITAVYAEELTEDGLLAALRSRRVYATEDADLEIQYTLDGYPMGSRLKLRHVGQTMSLAVSLSDPSDGASALVEVLGCGGSVLAARQIQGTDCISLPGEPGWYLLRITQPDGDLAVTAPVWIDGQEALEITSLICETQVPVQMEPVCLTMTFSNPDTAPFLVEQAEILADGKIVETLREPFQVNAGSECRRSFFFSCDCVGLTDITLRLSGTLEGSPRSYEETLTLAFYQSDTHSKILVDAGHGNAGLDQLNTLQTLARRENITLTAAEEITAELLKDCRILLVTLPSRPFSREFLEITADYVSYGGTLVVCGTADRNGDSPAELNRLLEAVGSSMSLRTDTVRDPVTNGGRDWQLFPEDINRADAWCAGVTADQIYRLYSGCSMDPGNGTWLVRGSSTTQPENAVVMAWQPLSGGAVFAAGSLFLTDDDLEAPKNLWDLPYANRTIARNLLGIGEDSASVIPIGQARLAPEDSYVRLRGHITAGNTNRYNTFPDTVYLQDDTGGIAVMPFPETIQTGTPMEVYGYIQTREGNRVLKLSHWKVLEETMYYHPPKTGDWTELLDPAKHSGTLVEVEGKCLEIYCREDDTLAGCLLEDGNGNLAIVEIEDSIFAGSDGENDLHKEICRGRTIRAMGLLHVNGYGETVLRVRNCEEVFYVPPRRYYNPRTEDRLLPVPLTAMTLSLTALVLLTRKRRSVH